MKKRPTILDEVDKFFARKNYSRESFLRDAWTPSKHITISGRTKVGKGALMDVLKNILGSGYTYVGIGLIVRQIGEMEGMPDINVFNEYMKNHPEKDYDQKFDELAVRHGLTRDALVLDSRLGHITVPQGFHVLVECNPAVRAHRYHKNMSVDKTKKQKTLGQACEEIILRDFGNDERYDRYYPGWDWSAKDFDFVINTEHVTSEEEAVLVLEAYSRWLKEQAKLCRRFRHPCIKTRISEHAFMATAEHVHIATELFKANQETQLAA